MTQQLIFWFNCTTYLRCYLFHVTVCQQFRSHFDWPVDPPRWLMWWLRMHKCVETSWKAGAEKRHNTSLNGRCLSALLRFVVGAQAVLLGLTQKHQVFHCILFPKSQHSSEDFSYLSSIPDIWPGCHGQCQCKQLLSRSNVYFTFRGIFGVFQLEIKV